MSDKQFKIVIPGLDGGGTQVFEADTQEELNEKLKSAQENASAKIRELAQQNQALQEQLQQNATPENLGEGRQQFFNALYQNPDDAIIGVLERKMGMKWNEFLSDYGAVREGSYQARQNAINAEFAQEHPELLQVSREDDMNNATAISKILTENQWQYTKANLNAAYAVAKEQGKLKLNPVNPFPEMNLPAAPTTVQRPTGNVNTSASEEEFLNTAPLDKVKKYLQEKYGQTAKV